jgi:hypothetical protein
MPFSLQNDKKKWVKRFFEMKNLVRKVFKITLSKHNPYFDMGLGSEFSLKLWVWGLHACNSATNHLENFNQAFEHARAKEKHHYYTIPKTYLM